jgi:hypothetical protein
MGKSSRIGALAAALATVAFVSEAASATQIVVGESRLVIDVEFWGRSRIYSQNPDGHGENIVTYGEQVRGAFQIFADYAPPAQDTSGSSTDGKTYGRNRAGTLPTGASFVTSQWLSPLPERFTHGVSPFPGSVADDYVVIGDGARFEAGEPAKDWLIVSDQFTPNSLYEYGESLTIQLRTPFDVIQGEGLDQEFEVADLIASDGDFTHGFIQTRVNDVIQFFEFSLDRVRYSPRVCKP